MRRSVVTHCSGQCRPAIPAPTGRGGGRAAAGRGGGGRGARGPKVNEQQVTWDAPMRDDPTIAIIGGGLSGLVCGQALARKGVRCVVFDTGEHTAGGRLATRDSSKGSFRKEWLPADLAGANLAFDHAAQFFTATDPRFKALVDAWAAAGVVREWRGPVGTLHAKEGRFEPVGQEGGPRYVATGGMAQLAEHLANPGGRVETLMDVKRPLWVGRMSATPKGWQLTGNNRSLGFFDAVVIAHNGKCANRLAAPSGAPLVAQQLMRLRLNSLWALMVAFPEPLRVPGGFEGAFISGSPILSWAGNNTAKLGLHHPGHPGLQCWTLFSTGAYGRANKVPQESIPEEVAARVKDEMLEAFRQALGPAAKLPAPVAHRCQLWGAALPINSPRVPCILDPTSRVGVCGDWLTAGGDAAASMQAAALSGLELADRLAALKGLGGLNADAPGASAMEALAIGLHEPFAPLSNPDIGGFPGEKAAAAGNAAAAGDGAAAGGRSGRQGQQGRGWGWGRQEGAGQRQRGQQRQREPQASRV